MATAGISRRLSPCRPRAREAPMTVRRMRLRIPLRFRAPVPLLAVVVLAIAGVGVASAATAPAGGGSTAAALSTIGTHGWKVVSSATATQTGQAISSPGFDTSGWLSVTPDDAGAPGTEITALLQNGKCPNVFYADTMKTCLGNQKKNGPVTT